MEDLADFFVEAVETYSSGNKRERLARVDGRRTRHRTGSRAPPLLLDIRLLAYLGDGSFLGQHGRRLLGSGGALAHGANLCCKE